MQFHLNGYSPGDPTVTRLKQATDTTNTSLPTEVDVLIVGCGPAGLTLATQLAAFTDITTCIVEQKSGPLEKGQADGVSCRSMEMFNAFGFAHKLLQEAYWVNETTFWKPDPLNAQHIVRVGQIYDTEDDLSEFPHVILNQARIHDFYLEAMYNAPTALEPHYARRLLDLVVDEAAGPLDHAVTARFEPAGDGQEGAAETVKARYVVGCDGARSRVRKSIGLELHGDSANQAWGVMDILAVTDFPDIRMKGLIQSHDQGSIVLIPREGGYLIRIYVEMDRLDESQRVGERNITVEAIIAKANRVLRPYQLDVKQVVWWSVYEIGQRITSSFDDAALPKHTARHPHVFIAGDACHTHSPKAGQGMNVSMGDAFNLGWKLVAVLRGQSPPALLRSYSEERQAVAQDLINFDREWAGILSHRPTAGSHDKTAVASEETLEGYFIKSGRYTAGTAVRYAPSMLTSTTEHQHLATGFDIGTRLHSAPVMRLADGKPVQLGHVVQADARWRLLAFSDASAPTPLSAMGRLCTFLNDSPDSPVRRHTVQGSDIDGVIDVRAIFQQSNRALEINNTPAFLRPCKGAFGLTDYEKMFTADLRGGKDIFDMRGINRRLGCMVIVRPDQYVAHVLPLDAYEQLATYFKAFFNTADVQGN
jgi:phenol 2-monooxygenase